MDAHSVSSRTKAHHGRRCTTAPRAAWTDLPQAATFAQVPGVLCSTCLAADESVLDRLAGAEHPCVARATCPTCGVSSIEYGLTLSLDAALAEMTGLDRLDGAL